MVLRVMQMMMTINFFGAGPVKENLMYKRFLYALVFNRWTWSGAETEVDLNPDIHWSIITSDLCWRSQHLATCCFQLSLLVVSVFRCRKLYLKPAWLCLYQSCDCPVVTLVICRIQGGRGWLAFVDRSKIPRGFRRARFCKFSRKNINFYNCGKTGHLWLSKDLHTHRHAP